MRISDWSSDVCFFRSRLARQRDLGILAPDIAAHTPRNRDGSWDSLTAEQQRLAARNMEIYAAMVDRLDQNVGRVLDALRAAGQLDKIGRASCRERGCQYV